MAGILEPLLGGMGALVVQFIITLIAVLALIAVAVWAIRMFMGGRLRLPGGRATRLGIVDAVSVDARRRLVLVRRDQFEHLILIGGPTDIVVEQTIFRGVPLTARLRPEGARPAQSPVQPQAAAMHGPPVQPPVSAPAPPPARPRRAPVEAVEQDEPVQHRLQSTPAAAFAPPGMTEREPERADAEEHIFTPPLPPEAPGPLVEPPRTPPMRPERDVGEEQAVRAAAAEASAAALEHLREARDTLRLMPEPARPAAAAAARPAPMDEPAERLGLWQSKTGRYEFLGPPRAPAPYAEQRDADLEAWSRDHYERDATDGPHANGGNGPTPEQVSNLEQEMARLLGEIAGKRTS